MHGRPCVYFCKQTEGNPKKQWLNCQSSENRSAPLLASDLQRVSSHGVLEFMIDSRTVDYSISLGHPSRRLCFACALPLIDGSTWALLMRHSTLLTLKLNTAIAASLRTTHRNSSIHIDLHQFSHLHGPLWLTAGRHSQFHPSVHLCTSFSFSSTLSIPHESVRLSDELQC